MTNPKTIGEMSEGQVLAAFLRSGETVLTPFGDNQRYDLVLDRSGIFVRVQVKTGRLKGGVIRFKLRSITTSGGKPVMVHYRGAADYFAVYCPETDKVYMVSVADCGVSEGALRVDKPRNNQVRGSRLAVDHEYPHGRIAQQVGAPG